ncbi:hypothetical protein V5799_004631 [Amblyomma americanum]|uniref:Uncharacterized protein n=1 Tax=Amblyomma americanum TaxID=6943 RepID=A0AAQ4D5I7_AMBAM
MMMMKRFSAFCGMGENSSPARGYLKTSVKIVVKTFLLFNLGVKNNETETILNFERLWTGIAISRPVARHTSCGAQSCSGVRCLHGRVPLFYFVFLLNGNTFSDGHRQVGGRRKSGGHAEKTLTSSSL